MKKNYTGHKRDAKKEGFQKVEKQTTNLACLRFQQSTNASGIIPTDLNKYYENIDSWSFSPVLTAVLSSGKPLRCTMHYIFKSYEFFEKGLADESVFFNFADKLESAYQKVS